MVTSITRFPLPAGLSLTAYQDALIHLAPEFRKPPGLLSKAFVVSDDGTHAGGVYLWQSREDAAAFEPALRSMIRARMGVEASITYFQTPVLVDNRRGTIETS